MGVSSKAIACCAALIRHQIAVLVCALAKPGLLAHYTAALL